jgi:hypothetical protein
MRVFILLRVKKKKRLEVTIPKLPKASGQQVSFALL